LLLNNFLSFTIHGYLIIFGKFLIIFRNWGEEPLFLVDLIDTNEVFENASTIVEPWRWVKNDDSSRLEDNKLQSNLLISKLWRRKIGSFTTGY